MNERFRFVEFFVFNLYVRFYIYKLSRFEDTYFLLLQMLSHLALVEYFDKEPLLITM